jgi:hypothetical protein
MSKKEKEILVKQQTFVGEVGGRMIHVLQRCQERKDDCICSFQTTYLHDRPDLDESTRYRISLFCGRNTPADNTFFSKTERALREVNSDFDPISQIKEKTYCP